jgi:hypothetical protein
MSLEVVLFEGMSLEMVAVEIVPLEVASLEVASLEVASLGTMPRDGSTAVTAPEMMTITACRLAGRADRQHDRQCAESHERDPFHTCKLLHDGVSFSPPLLSDGHSVTKIHPRSAPRARRSAAICPDENAQLDAASSTPSPSGGKGYRQEESSARLAVRERFDPLPVPPPPTAGIRGPAHHGPARAARRRSAASVHGSGLCRVPVDFDYSSGKRIRSFLRHVVADAIENSVRIFP